MAKADSKSYMKTLVMLLTIDLKIGGSELEDIWRTSAGERVASKSYVKRLKSGVLEIGVTNGAILEELTCYLKHELLPAIQQKHPEPPITSLKFVKAR